MKRKNTKILTIVGIILLLTSAFFAIFIVFLNGLMAPNTETSAPHYLKYRGAESRIFLVSATPSCTLVNRTYTSGTGMYVKAGSQIYTLDLTLRNDYSSDNPPPSTGTPIAPIDGTAYLCLTATLFDNDKAVNATNLSLSDFSTFSNDQTGIVLASGQADTIQLILAANQTVITDFTINLVLVSDCIPR